MDALMMHPFYIFDRWYFLRLKFNKIVLKGLSDAIKCKVMWSWVFFTIFFNGTTSWGLQHLAYCNISSCDLSTL